MNPATPLIARCATAMRVSPFGSLAFMLPDASRINRTERSAVLQDWASAAAGSTPAASATRHERIFFARNDPLQVGRWPIAGSWPSYPNTGGGGQRLKGRPAGVRARHPLTQDRVVFALQGDHHSRRSRARPPCQLPSLAGAGARSDHSISRHELSRLAMFIAHETVRLKKLIDAVGVRLESRRKRLFHQSDRTGKAAFVTIEWGLFGHSGIAV